MAIVLKDVCLYTVILEVIYKVSGDELWELEPRLKARCLSLDYYDRLTNINLNC